MIKTFLYGVSYLVVAYLIYANMAETRSKFDAYDAAGDPTAMFITVVFGIGNTLIYVGCFIALALLRISHEFITFNEKIKFAATGPIEEYDGEEER